jgi:integrase
MHTLRHTHATELLAAGIPIVEVARRLGHSKISHTLELYGHAIKNYDEKIAKKVQELYVVPK